MSAPSVLLIDDNPANLRLAAFLLRANGFVVTPVVDADQALARLQDDVPDLIIVDVGLPGMDGLALTRHLKATPATADVPVIAVTAYAMVGDRERAMSAGCDAYLTKPIDPGTFAAVVARHLPHKRSP